jgi:hypothetical protein
MRFALLLTPVVEDGVGFDNEASTRRGVYFGEGERDGGELTLNKMPLGNCLFSSSVVNLSLGRS